MDNIDLLDNGILTGATIISGISSKTNKPWKALEISFTALDQEFSKLVFLEQAELAMLAAEVAKSAK